MLAALLPLSLFAGCTTVTLYQPQKAIHRPVVIERSPTNFAGLRILVSCHAHEAFLPRADASKLCSRIAQNLRQQGAETEFIIPYGATYVEPEVFDGQRPDLKIEIQSRIDHENDSPALTCVWCLTCTVLPTMSEQTFSQRVVVFGRDRSVLTEEVFRERFVEYSGCGVWSINWLLDWLFREDKDKLSGDVGKQDFTKDFYGQIRQITFNARIRSEVLGLTQGPASTRVIVDDTGSKAGTAPATADEPPKADAAPRLEY